MGLHPPRLKGFDYTGTHHYFVTFCTHERRPLFHDPHTVDLFREQLLQSSRAHDIAVHAYCAMPDHVHLLLQGTSENTELGPFMCHLKQHSAWRFREKVGTRMWQGSYHDHVVRPEEGTAGIIAYIVNNPVRAGLVDKLEDYPFWGSFTLTRENVLALIEGVALWTPPAVNTDGVVSP